jgi:hypothetical protein
MNKQYLTFLTVSTEGIANGFIVSAEYRDDEGFERVQYLEVTPAKLKKRLKALLNEVIEDQKEKNIAS